MIDRDSFNHHKVICTRNIEFKIKKNKILLNVDSITKEVTDYFQFHEDELTEYGIPLALLLSEVRSNFRIRIKRRENFINIDNSNHVDWYFDDSKENRPFWDRYFEHLTQGSMPKVSRDALNEHTDGILSRCENPKDTNRSWQTKALVLGSVQQGKTSNYIGLTCKAADAGYKLFIILTGMHDDLRTQTQIRFDEGFTGYESSTLTEYDESTKSVIGAGMFNPNLNAHTITHRRKTGDVKKSMLFSYNGNAFASETEKPHIIVCKKNGSVLKNITDWIENFPRINNDPNEKIIPEIPLFIIDDEADQASVDTSRTNSPKKINGQIRRIINTFTNSCYIAYTATAYANLLIDHGRQRASQTVKEKQKIINEEGEKETIEIIKEAGPDLFPRDFITLMPEPDNYVGFEEVFPNENTEDFDTKLEESERYIRIIDDHYDEGSDGETGWMPISAHSRKINNFIPLFEGKEEIPPSLKRAIYTFILTSAVKSLRNLSEKHSSMMVHVTYKNAIQNQVRDQIDNFVKILKTELHSFNEKNEHWKQLKLLWDNDINFKKHINNNENPNGQSLDWETIINTIIYPDKDSVIDRLATIQLSGTSPEILNYNDYKEKGSVLIVVGGTKLSRGLTLSGLCVSYFARYSAQKLADTVTQMARWFGYRDGYKDVCRIYLTESAREAFSEFSSLDVDTRGQVEALDRRSDLTPDKVLITLQSSTGYLVTSKLKMQSGIKQNLNLTSTSSSIRSLYASQNPANKKAVMAFVEKLTKNAPVYINKMGEKYSKKQIQSLNKYDLIWKVGYEEIIKFLENYQFASSNIKLQQGTWEKYIKLKVNSCQELINWNVIVKGRGEGNKNILKINDYSFIPSIRTNKARGDDKIDIGTLFSGQDCKTILTKQEEEFAKSNLEDDKKLVMSKAIAAYSAGKKNKELEGFLFIGPVMTENKNENEILYPISIVFPDSEKIESIEITINQATVKVIKELFGDEGTSEDEVFDEEE